MEGQDATSDVSHTAEWIASFVREVIDAIGPSRFSGVVSDSTGNTRKARGLLNHEIPTLLPLADICHHLGNTIKDIVSLAHFKPVIGPLRKTITKFHKSHIGTAELTTARRELRIVGGGLEAIGKTRFGTLILSARALQRNIPAIKRVVEQGRFDLGDLAENFQEVLSQTTADFQIGLSHLVNIGNPAIKALTVLEANEATAADTYIFWHAVLSSTLEAASKANLPSVVQLQISKILNHRHNQIMGGGNLSSALYVVAAYLHPGVRYSSLLSP
ncbi:hypothetical protein BDN72DRAFT_933920 [Pluteus cervinus]|uniref:Uncharacterized protein n=1 Tax=Pluteus cervinus TaxID=181527 RepID=A0ACD3A8C3_9AGAR|nr:hypothetical protein BDN72DRAFT_933920 [Pluteus cervinus]